MKRNIIKGQFTILNLLVLLGLMLQFSCVDESGREGRKLISRGGTTTQEPTFCNDTFYITERSCISSCPTGTRVATENEVEEAKVELQALDLTPEDLESILNNIDSAVDVCVDGSGILRPDNQVFIDSSFCACQAGKPISINDCAATCQSKTQTSLVLFGKVTVGADILFNDVLGNLQNWCNVEIPGSDFVTPQCQLEVFDGISKNYLNMDVAGNSFQVNLDQLDFDKTYVAKIVETGSTSMVQSQAFQFRLKEFVPESTTPEGPLKIMPVNQYACVELARQPDPESFTNHAKKHYYFAASNNPPSLPPNQELVKCHDKQIFGEADSPLFPRLDLIPQHFAVWDQSDIRFNDGDVDGTIDINEEVTQEFRDRTGSTDANLNLFTVFQWPNIPQIPEFKNIVNANLGFIMIPFVDAQNRGECPTQEDYLGDNVLYQIIGEKVGVDTEGLFMAESEPILDTSGASTFDIIMVREGQLKKAWFYFENGQHFVPDAITAGSKTIHFYYPFDFNAPYVRKSDQLIYTVRFPDQIGKGGVQTGIVEGIRPPDKRFACIPAID